MTTTTPHTLLELANIGSLAACRFVESPDREKAFVQAVLDAVGYKLPVDPDREAFEKWHAANPNQSNTEDLFTAWKAGREQERKEAEIWLTEIEKHEAERLQAALARNPFTQMLDKEPSQTETFEAHGLTWIKHTPGNRMPCDKDSIVEFLLQDGTIHRGRAGFTVAWTHGKSQIIGWRYEGKDPAKQPENDGWRDWPGGECPVDKVAKVEVRYRGLDGSDISQAGIFRWSHTDHRTDIIAYKIVTP
jgi:hypothetical protein